MTDERLLRTFRRLDEPAVPAAAFADRLFEDLAADLGFRRAGRPVRSIGARARRALGLDRLPTGSAALRLAYLAAMVGLLLALAIGMVLVASLLQTRPSPLELVRLSQAAYRNPPAVRMTFGFIGSARELTLSSDGDGTWRTDDGTDGSYSLYQADGTRSGWYDGSVGTWASGPVAERGAPDPFNDEFTWDTNDGRVEWIPLACDGAMDLGTTTLIGRPVDHVSCPDVDLDYWLDRETHLVLRMQAGPDNPRWIGGEGQPAGIEIRTFELGPMADSDFAWAGPPGAFSECAPPASRTLVVGQRPPAWSGETIDGRGWTTETLDAPAVLLFHANWATGSLAAWDDFGAAAARYPGVTGVIVASDGVSFAGLHPTLLDVVADRNDRLLRTWGITGFPTVVLLDGEGRVSGAARGPFSAQDLEAMLGAAADGRPIPSIVPSPEPTPASSCP